MNHFSHTLNLDLQSIEFQSNYFFKSITALIESYRKERDETPENFAKLLKKLIWDEKKITMDVNVFDATKARNLAFGAISITIPPLKVNHIFYPTPLRQDAGYDVSTALSKIDGFLKGGIDRKQAQLTGDFCKVPFTLNISDYILNDKRLEPASLAAKILHEIGHVFNYFEYISATLTMNQVFAALHNKYTGLNESDRVKVLTSIKNILELDRMDPTRYKEITDLETVEIVIMNECVETAVRKNGFNIYDFTMFEYLSDEFVARHGGGKDLVIAIDTLQKNFPDAANRTLANYIGIESFKVVLLAMAAVAPAVAFGPILLSSVLIWLDAQSATYDTPKRRCERIRNQIQEAAKDKNMTQEHVRKLSDDLAIINSHIDEMQDRRQIFDVVSDFFIRSRSKQRDYKVLQGKLEDLANNALFLKSHSIQDLLK